MEIYPRLMFLKFRYRLGYESLCREVTDSITWRPSCRILLDGTVSASDNADETDHPLRRSCRFGMQRGPAREVCSVECQTVERIASSTNIRTCRKRRLRRRAGALSKTLA
jgi:IS5 family transposase